MSSIFSEGSDELFETIGMKILEQWTSEMESKTSESRSMNVSNEAETKLHELIETPMRETGSEWSQRARDLIESMSPTDFAAYGKQLCLFLLKRGDAHIEEVSVEETLVSDLKTDDDQSISYIQPPKPKVQPKSIEKGLYTSFPEWLPTV